MLHHFTVGEIVANVSRLGDYDNAPSIPPGSGPPVENLYAVPPVEMIPIDSIENIRSWRERMGAENGRGVSSKGSMNSIGTIRNVGVGIGIEEPLTTPMRETSRREGKAKEKQREGDHGGPGVPTAKPSMHQHQFSFQGDYSPERGKDPARMAIPVHTKGGAVKEKYRMQ
jgi:hypothetical protein